ncbi:MAG: cache domain-containing protein [Pseudomonadota bacterium]
MDRRKALMSIALAAAAASGARAGENGSADEAVAMVKKTIAFMKANGDEKAFAEVSNPKGQFVDRDLYVFIALIGGNTMAHGANPRMIGKRMVELKDRDGKYFIREFENVVETKGSGWVDYKWPHPVSKEIVQKSTYVEKFGKYLVGCGIYK